MIQVCPFVVSCVLIVAAFTPGPTLAAVPPELEPLPPVPLPPFNQAGYANVSPADVDGDGLLDLVTYWTIGLARLDTRLNNGDGTFGEPVTSLVIRSAESRAFGDLDGDGDDDAVLGVLPEEGTNVRIMIADGTGQFVFHKDLKTAATFAGPVALGDVNGDDILDLVSPTSTQLSVMLGLGGGEFAQPTESGASEGSGHALVLADVEGDGDLDALSRATLASTDIASSRYSVSLNNGSGVFTPADEFNLDVRSFGDRLVQLDADPARELVVYGRDGTDFGDGGCTSSSGRARSTPWSSTSCTTNFAPRHSSR
jgi:hypothetical protein